MKRLLLFINLLCFVFVSKGQNLVMNPSFEDTIPCNQVNYPPSFSCYPWFLATSGNVDYFSETNVGHIQLLKVFLDFNMQEQELPIVDFLYMKIYLSFIIIENI